MARHYFPCPLKCSGRVSTTPGNTGNYWNLISFLDILEISRNLIGPTRKLQNVGNKAVIDAVLVSWLDVAVMSVGRSSSSHAQLEIVHTLLVVVILLIKLWQHKNLLTVSWNVFWKCTGNLFSWICRHLEWCQTVTFNGQLQYSLPSWSNVHF